MSASPDPSTSLPRSTRTRVKSQRAIESEFADRLFSRSKDKPIDPEREASQARPRAKGKSKAPRKRGKKEELYCLCRTDGKDGRPMIECGECSDW